MLVHLKSKCLIRLVRPKIIIHALLLSKLLHNHKSKLKINLTIRRLHLKFLNLKLVIKLKKKDFPPKFLNQEVIVKLRIRSLLRKFFNKKLVTNLMKKNLKLKLNN